MSTSSGEFNITYSLAGLGFYNLTFTKQSSLSVEILESLAVGKARFSVQVEGSEPLISLTKANFKFYRYDTAGQIWELAPLTVEPSVFANGTYVLTVPSGVDASEYLVQVEDARGIMTVASSFSRYVTTLNWNNGQGVEDYVDTNSALHDSPNKGSHSNFNAQKIVDSLYDTLTEAKTGGAASNTSLVSGESFEGTWRPSGWTEDPTTSYWGLGTIGASGSSHSAYFPGGSGRSGYLITPSLDCAGATAIYVDFYYRDGGCEPGEFLLRYFDGTNWDVSGSVDLANTSPENQWHHYQQKITDSKYFKSNFKVGFYATTNYGNDYAWIDLVTVTKEIDNSNYELDLEEQWTNVTLVNPNLNLCIKTGTLGSESLKVDVWHNGAWVTNVINGLEANTWNNVSISSYVSANFTIRFRGGSESSDSSQTSWDIDATLLSPPSDLGTLLATQQDSTITVEWLQNGTIRWLGQNFQLASAEKPIPPISVKAFHLIQTIGGVSQEVPFQVEDWASGYRVPLGMTNEATVFSNEQMLVFLIDRDVSSFTLWWDGSDLATQTSFAYTPGPFSDDTAHGVLNNGRLRLEFGGGFTLTSTLGASSTTATFMRINGEASVYGANPAYVISNGVVRDIVQQESEWSGGADGCPNIYANVVITLPAGTSYYTYQMRLMFMNSQQARTITDLCPIKLSSQSGSPQIMTENGTAGSYPIVVNGTGIFRNYGAQTEHHWSQLISGNNGAGILFTDSANQKLYAFDSIAGGATGALSVSTSSRTIEFAPVTSLRSASFTTPMDIIWQGAVATFDSTATPIYKLDSGTATGLWILTEYQPQITVTAET
jgi:hypothetical protein